MEKVIFTKNGILGTFWDAKSSKWIDRELKDSNLPISWFLPHQTSIADGVCVSDVIKGLEPFYDQVNFIFVNALMGINIQDFFKALNESSISENTVKTDNVCLLWNGEIRENPENEDEISIFPTLHSLESSTLDDELDEFHSLYDISSKDLLFKPLLLDDWLDFFKSSNIQETILEGGFSWNLYDFLSGLFSEISLYCYKTGLVKLAEGSQVGPLNITELFEHIDDLDNFYKEL